jgi:CO/xanthine dehydrogenase FAD-binding subunit
MLPAREQPQTFAPAGLERAALVRPKTMDEACALLAAATREKRAAVVLAGGTDWIVDRHLMPIDRASAVEVVIDVTGVRDLAAVRFHEAHGETRVTLGGGVTYWTLRQHAELRAALPMLAEMAKDVGAVQIQTRGTLAGNIASASPAADGVPALLALDGEVTLVSAAGTRKVKLESFFVSYRKTVLAKDELIASIDVRVPSPGARVAWRKVGTRLAQAISKVALASVIETDARGLVTRARFGMASVAPITTSLPHVRARLEGAALASVDRAALEEALAEDITPIDDVRSTGEYRMHVAKALVWRAVQHTS